MKHASPRIVLATLGLLSIPVGLAVHAANRLQGSEEGQDVLVRKPAEMDYNPFRASPEPDPAKPGPDPRSARAPQNSNAQVSDEQAPQVERLPAVGQAPQRVTSTPSRPSAPEVTVTRGAESPSAPSGAGESTPWWNRISHQLSDKSTNAPPRQTGFVDPQRFMPRADASDADDSSARSSGIVRLPAVEPSESGRLTAAGDRSTRRSRELESAIANAIASDPVAADTVTADKQPRQDSSTQAQQHVGGVVRGPAQPAIGQALPVDLGMPAAPEIDRNTLPVKRPATSPEEQLTANRIAAAETTSEDPYQLEQDNSRVEPRSPAASPAQTVASTQLAVHQDQASGAGAIRPTSGIASPAFTASPASRGTPANRTAAADEDQGQPPGRSFSTPTIEVQGGLQQSQSRTGLGSSGVINLAPRVSGERFENHSKASAADEQAAEEVISPESSGLDETYRVENLPAPSLPGSSDGTDQANGASIPTAETESRDPSQSHTAGSQGPVIVASSGASGVRPSDLASPQAAAGDREAEADVSATREAAETGVSSQRRVQRPFDELAAANYETAAQGTSVEPPLPQTPSVLDPTAPIYSYDEPLVELPEGAEALEDELFSDPFAQPPGSALTPGCPAKWYGIGEYLVYQPEMGSVRISNALETNQAFFRSGGRATLGYRSDCLSGWEVSFMQLENRADIESSAALGFPGLLTTRFIPTGGLTSADVSSFNGAGIEHVQDHRLEYADLQFNRVTWGWDVFNTKYGLRITRVQENVALGSGLAGTPIESMPGLFQQQIENTLIGPQFGLSFIDDSRGNWTIDTNLSVAGYVNLLNGDTRFRNAGGATTINNVGIDAIKGALSGEVSAGIAYHLTPNLKIRAGFDAIYYYGLGTVSEQLQAETIPFTGGYRLTPGIGSLLRNNDDMLLWGGSVGIYGNWP